MNSVSLNIAKVYECDVFVAGGGVSGFSAAVGAARTGAKVILCEADGYLGGSATRSFVGPFMTCYDRAEKNQIIKGIFEEVVQKLVSMNGAIYHTNCPGRDSYSGYRIHGHYGVTPFSMEALKLALDEISQDAGVKLLYHSRVVGCDVCNDEIKTVYIASPAGLEAIKAKVFIDTTGNASMAASAGAETIFKDEDGFVQTASMFFTITNVNKKKLEDAIGDSDDYRKRFFMDIFENAIETGEFPCGTVKLRIFEGMDDTWTVNMAQEDSIVVDFDTENLTNSEISQRKQISEIYEFLKKHIPGLEDIKLIASAPAIGVRESRRILGKTLLTKDDIQNSRYYDERICVCSNSIDVHLKKGVDYHVCENNYYIPLNCLISKNISNLMGAGKTVSADKYAFSAVRVMPPCFAMGQAAGITSALAVLNNKKVLDVDVKDVQEIIIENGGYLG